MTLFFSSARCDSQKILIFCIPRNDPKLPEAGRLLVLDQYFTEVY